MNIVAPIFTKPSTAGTIETESTDRDILYRKAAQEYGSALARLVNAYEANIEQQQDLLQDIHLALWRSLAGFNNQCSLRTWTYRVAHNVATTHVLRSKRRRSSQLVSIEELENMPHDHDGERVVDEDAVLQRLSKLIRRLKTVDRDVILLYLEGTEATEIGEVVGLTPSNVAQKVHRIKKYLQQHFSNGDAHVGHAR